MHSLYRFCALQGARRAGILCRKPNTQTFVHKRTIKNPLVWGGKELNSSTNDLPMTKMINEAKEIAKRLNIKPKEALVTTRLRENLFYIEFETLNSKANVLSLEMFIELYNALEKAIERHDINSIILVSKKPHSFFAGADIELIHQLKGEDLHKMVELAENFGKYLRRYEKPIYSIISGHCLGGGLEVAMNGYQRIVIDTGNVSFGFPEVKLGLLPGMGGTLLSYKHLEFSDAFNLLCTGSTISLKEAKRIDIVDHVIKNKTSITENSHEEMMDYIHNQIEAYVKYHSVFFYFGMRRYRTCHEAELIVYRFFDKFDLLFHFLSYISGYHYIRKILYQYAILSKTRGLYPAPLELLDLSSKVAWLMREGHKKEEEVFEIERPSFIKLHQTPQSYALRSLYLGMDLVKKEKYNPPEKEIKNVSILGSGLMGAGIAHETALKAKCSLTLYDISPKSLNSGASTILKNLYQTVEKGFLKKSQADNIHSNIKFTSDINDVKDSDIIIEAIPEELELKKKVLGGLENIVSPSCILATNTSAITIKEISEGLSRPQNCVGMHYFSPVPKMELLEIVKGEKTSMEALNVAVSLGRKQGKLCIVVKDSPGFYTTRIISTVLGEIIHLINEGVRPQRIDNAMLNVGFPVGPVKLIDNVGLDVSLHILKYLILKLGDRFDGDFSLLESLVNKGHLGKKTRVGIYDYRKKTIGNVGDSVLNFIKSFGSSDSKISEKEIVDRFMCIFINECIHCLDEGVISSPYVGDVGAVFGVGFPPLLKGPFYYCDLIGTSQIIENMKYFKTKYPGRSHFEPSKLLLQMDQENKKFFPENTY